MFNIQVTTTVHGKSVSLETFIGALFNHFIQGVAREMTKQPEVPPQVIVQTVAPPTKPEPLVVGIQETARLIGLKPSTVRAMLSTSRIPSVRLGRRVLIPMDAIRKIVHEGIPPKDLRPR